MNIHVKRGDGAEGFDKQKGEGVTDFYSGYPSVFYQLVKG